MIGVIFAICYLPPWNTYPSSHLFIYPCFTLSIHFCPFILHSFILSSQPSICPCLILSSLCPLFFIQIFIHLSIHSISFLSTFPPMPFTIPTHPHPAVHPSVTPLQDSIARPFILRLTHRKLSSESPPFPPCANGPHLPPAMRWGLAAALQLPVTNGAACLSRAHRPVTLV